MLLVRKCEFIRWSVEVRGLEQSGILCCTISFGELLEWAGASGFMIKNGSARVKRATSEPGGVGFLLGVPRPGTPREGPGPEPGAGLAFLAEHYDFYHGAAEVPESLMQGFVRRRQQIGIRVVTIALIYRLYLLQRKIYIGRSFIQSEIQSSDLSQKL